MLMSLVTAMSQNDKETREMLYADLTVEDLRRVLRWSIRWYLELFRDVALMGGVNPEEALKSFFLAYSLALTEKDETE